VASVPEGPDWSYELKLDGYRLEAVRDNGRSKLFSRRGHDLTKQFPWIAGALDHLQRERLSMANWSRSRRMAGPISISSRTTVQRTPTSSFMFSIFWCSEIRA